MKNKYKVPYEERIIAFVDIMGFKDLVDESANDFDKIIMIRSALESFRNLKEEKEEPEIKKKVKVTTFSDSLVISYPLDCEDALFEIFMDLIYLQFSFAYLGIFIRGGIAIGKLRHIQEEIFGPAMNCAYEIESKKAIYPRIVIDNDDLMKGINATVRKNVITHKPDVGDVKEIMSLLKKGTDKLYYLDYLRLSDEFDYPEDYYQMLAKVKNAIIYQLDKNKEKSEVIKKYEWLQKYYNGVVKDLKYNELILK